MRAPLPTGTSARSSTATVAPASVSCRTTASPMPDDPPVTTALAPSRSTDSHVMASAPPGRRTGSERRLFHLLRCHQQGIARFEKRLETDQKLRPALADHSEDRASGLEAAMDDGHLTISPTGSSSNVACDRGSAEKLAK